MASPNNSMSRKMVVLSPSSQITARVNGGKLSVISRVRTKGHSSVLTSDYYLSGSGTTGKLRCQVASTARTPNITLSFETSRVARVPLLTVWTYSQSAAFVARQTTSWAAPPADGSHVRVVSFSRSLVSIFTAAGGAGADASEARVAAFSRATLAT